MKKFSSDKDINKLVMKLCKLGCKFIHRKKHGALLTPSGRKITVPCSPSDRRAFKDFSSDIRSILSKECNYA